MVRAVALAGIVAAVGSASMQLRSPDFSGGGPLPRALMAAECGGENRSPALTWTNAPRGTKSFALVLHDSDAPIPGGFYHWVVYNLPAGTLRLSANARPALDQLGDTSLGKSGYYGPCPPPGPAHHYRLTLYALDVSRLVDRGGMTGAQLLGRIAGHTLARATLQGTASRP